MKVDDSLPSDCLGRAIDAGAKIWGFSTGGGIFVLKRLFKIVCLSNSSSPLMGLPMGCQLFSEAQGGLAG